MNEENRAIRIVLADDHYVVRLGLKALLESDSRLTVVAEAGRGEEAIEQYRRHCPDLMLMDVRMPGMNGIEAVARIRKEFPKARIVMLTAFDGDEDIHQALRAGAQSYLLKSMPGPEFLAAIHRVDEGQRFLPKKVASRLAERTPCSDLTPRELEVLELAGKGFTYREIAKLLGVTGNTIRTHLKTVFAKLDVNNRAEAVAAAFHRGILHLD